MYCVPGTPVGRAQREAGTIEAGDPVLDVVRYVERNPLRAGLVASAEQWRWSSLHWWRYAKSAPAFWRRDVIWRPKNWLKQVNRPETDAELAALRLSVRLDNIGKGIRGEPCVRPPLERRFGARPRGACPIRANTRFAPTGIAAGRDMRPKSHHSRCVWVSRGLTERPT